MKAYPGQSGTGLVLYDAWAVPGVITDMCCLLKHFINTSKPTELPPNPVQQNAAVSAYTAHDHRPGWVVEAIQQYSVYSTIQQYSNTAYTVYSTTHTPSWPCLLA